MTPSHYPAKLLLFGEYTVLHGSQALAVPLRKWSGHWIQQKNAETDIPQYYRWLHEEGISEQDIFQKMSDDHSGGWQYVADIPMGYGVGSSGAYVAAIFDRYLSSSIPEQSITATLARMESYFHGSSSGMDPLVSFSKNAVYKNEDGKFVSLQDPGWPAGYNVYLLDSGMTRETGSLVKNYLNKISSEAVGEKIKNELIPMVEHGLHFYLSGERTMLPDCISMISQFQRIHFEEMIPDLVKAQWDQLASLSGVHIKLCGAGGGGYFLVIDTEQNHQLDDFALIRIQ